MKRFFTALGIAAAVFAVAAALAAGLYLMLRGGLLQAVELRAPSNTRRQDDFSVDENGYVTYPGAVMGVDVSAFQGEIDWEAAKEAGVRFAILRIGFRGYSAGSLNEDERFEQNYQGARDAGLDVGVYFYSQATSNTEAVEEAEYVLQLLSGRALQLPVFFDWEEVSDGRTGGKATTAVTGFAQNFCSRVSAGGYRPGVYFNQTYGYSIMQLGRMKQYEFWLAEYQNTQSFGYEVQFWQYTGNGHVDGIETRVDLDLMYAKGE